MTNPEESGHTARKGEHVVESVEATAHGGFAIDAAPWPHVRIVARGHLGATDVAPHFAEFGALFDRGSPFTIEYDTVGVTFVAWSMRREYARFIADHEAGFRDLCRGVGFVITSPVVRAALTAVLWITPLPCPHAVFRGPEEASAWCRSRRLD